MCPLSRLEPLQRQPAAWEQYAAYHPWPAVEGMQTPEDCNRTLEVVRNGHLARDSLCSGARVAI